MPLPRRGDFVPRHAWTYDATGDGDNTGYADTDKGEQERRQTEAKDKKKKPDATIRLRRRATENGAQRRNRRPRRLSPRPFVPSPHIAITPLIRLVHRIATPPLVPPTPSSSCHYRPPLSPTYATASGKSRARPRRPPHERAAPPPHSPTDDEKMS